MDADLAQRLKAIDPGTLGRHIKRARVARDLTQGDLAGGEVSVAYVSRIESGKRRPELAVLAHLAQRLGTTAADLIEGTVDDESQVRLTLDYAELELASGDPSTALAHVSSVLSNDVARSSDLRWRAQSVQAGAAEALGDYDTAITVLETITSDACDDVHWLRASVALSRCYRETGDLERARDIGEAAMARVTTHRLTGTDDAVQVAVTLAATYFLRGDVGHAVRLCRKAIADAEAVGSPTARASAYWNASVMAGEQGDVASALSLAQSALALLEQGEDARNLARLRSQLGIYQLRLDPPDITGALSNLHVASREFAWSSASPVDAARNDLALARAAFLSGDPADAGKRARAARDSMLDSAPILAAEAAVLIGQIALSTRQRKRGAEAFRQAVHILTAVGSDRGAAHLWFELAGWLQKVGDVDSALDAYQRGAAATGFTAAASHPARV